MDFLKYSKLYFLFSGLLILASFVFIFQGGLKPGIEFTGGTLLRLDFKSDFEFSKLQKEMQKILGGNFILQRVGERGALLKTREFSEEKKEKILQALGKIGEIDKDTLEVRAIEAMIGGELKKSTFISLILAFLFILFYIALAFRRAVFKGGAFKYGFAGLAALFHDVLIASGAFALAGIRVGFEVGIPFIAGILTVIGYSINDTIIIFDRLRENLLKKREISKEVFNDSLNQVVVRSLFTCLTTLLPLFAIFFWGSKTLVPFVFVLIVGIAIGTYSSIFIATPILYRLMKR